VDIFGKLLCYKLTFNNWADFTESLLQMRISGRMSVRHVLMVRLLSSQVAELDFRLHVNTYRRWMDPVPSGNISHLAVYITFDNIVCLFRTMLIIFLQELSSATPNCQSRDFMSSTMQR
jgi:hypothetical protein